MYTLLRKVREARGISQIALARKAGVSPSYLNKIENGQVSIPDKLKAAAQKIADFFDNEITEVQILFPERYSNGIGGKRAVLDPAHTETRRATDKPFAEKERT